MLRSTCQQWAVVSFLVLAAVEATLSEVEGALFEVTATKSLTVQSAGSRAGDAGSNYFNIEGKNKERYASFGVLVFPLNKSEAAPQPNELTLTLVRSIPGFASDGAVKFYLAEPANTDKDSLEKLKFDTSVASGLGRDSFKALHELGRGTFKKVETGHIDKFELTLDEPGGRYLRDLLRTAGLVHIVVVPDDADVAATFFGAGQETEANWPRLSFGPERAQSRK
jgi:hypothetical protein